MLRPYFIAYVAFVKIGLENKRDPMTIYVQVAHDMQLRITCWSNWKCYLSALRAGVSVVDLRPERILRRSRKLAGSTSSTGCSTSGLVHLFLANRIASPHILTPLKNIASTYNPDALICLSSLSFLERRSPDQKFYSKVNNLSTSYA